MVWQDYQDSLVDSSGAGPPAPGPDGRRFAILRHSRSEETHWDFLLDLPGRARLATWRIDTDPLQWFAGEKKEFTAIVRALPDHRRVYLTFEGPVSGDRGTVQRVDSGAALLFQTGDQKTQVELRGARLHVRISLLRDSDHPDLWHLCATPLGPVPT